MIKNLCLVLLFSFSCNGNDVELNESQSDSTSVIEYCSGGSATSSTNCALCPRGTIAGKSDDALSYFDRCEELLCQINERVIENQCVACPQGTENDAGDDASGENTECQATRCSENEYVYDHQCRHCRGWYVNEAGDDPTGPNTGCEPATCAENEYVLNYQCEPCREHTINQAGDRLIDSPTRCSDSCYPGYHVVANQCQPCPPGMDGRGNGWLDGNDTICDPVRCRAHQHVVSNQCVACAEGTYNERGDDASGVDTLCDQDLGLFIDPPALSDAEMTNACLNGQHLGNMSGAYSGYSGFEVTTSFTYLSFVHGLMLPTNGGALVFSQDIRTRSDQSFAALSFTGNVTRAALFSSDCSVLYQSNIPVTTGLTSNDFMVNGLFTDSEYRLVLQVPYYSNNPFMDPLTPQYKYEDRVDTNDTTFGVNYLVGLENGSSCEQAWDNPSGRGPWSCSNSCCAYWNRTPRAIECGDSLDFECDIL